MIVDALRCGDCESLFSSHEAGEPVYECSRCGETQVEDNRCQHCYVWMRKVWERSCGDCEGGDLTECEAWEGEDGQLFESEEAEREWIADAPNRERRRQEHEAYMKKMDAEFQAEREANQARVRPKVEHALEILPAGRCEGIRRTMRHALEIEGGRSVPNYSVPVYGEDMAAILGMEYPKFEVEGGDAFSPYRRGHEWVREELIPEALRAFRGPTIEESVDFLSYGGGPLIPIEDFCDALIDLYHQNEKA